MGERRSGASAQRGRPESFNRLTVTVEDRDGYALIVVVGEIDVTTGSELRDPLQAAFTRGLCHHVADLRAVTFLDSTGLGILVGDHKRVRDQGGSLQVVSGPGLVTRVFRLTGVDRVIPIRPTVEAAVASLPHPNTA